MHWEIVDIGINRDGKNLLIIARLSFEKHFYALLTSRKG